MGFITSRLIPRPARRAMHPVRTAKNAVTPRSIKQIRNAANSVTNPVNALGYEVTKSRAPRREWYWKRFLGFSRRRQILDLSIFAIIVLLVILGSL